MRILLLADCYLPGTKSSAKLVHDLGVEMVRSGHAVSIVCPDDSLAETRQISFESGLTVLRIRTGAIKGASRWLRGWNEARLSHTLWSAASDWFRQNPCDLIVFYSPTIFFGGLVSRLKSLWNCPAYLILRDIFPQWAVDAGVLRKGPAWAFFRWAERRQYRAADVIGVQSPANVDYFRQERLTDRHRLDILYNWTSLDEQSTPPTSFRRQWGLEDELLFFYGGNIGVAQDMDNILRLAAAMRHADDVHFLLVGDGSEVPRLRSSIEQQRLANVTLKPAVSQQEYLGLLAEVDVGLISLDRKLRTQNFPGKMLGYMQHRLPMLASVNPGNDLQDLVESHEVGLVCLNGDDDALAEAALSLARDAFLRRRLGHNGRKLLEARFSVAAAAGQILDHFHVAAAPRRAA